MNYNTDNPKFHEEVFNKVGDIVQECYKYLNEHEAEKLEIIYAIGSLEEGWYSFYPFFKIQNKLLKAGQIEDRDDCESQTGIQESGIDFLERLEAIFKSYNLKTPTQIKIIFFANSEEVRYNFEYDLLWSNRLDEGYQSENLYYEWY